MKIINRLRYAFTRKAAWIFVPLFLIGSFVPPTGPAHATFSTNTQISNGQGFLQGQFAQVGVRANGAFGSTSVPSGFNQNPANCLGFRVDREMDGWGVTTDDGDFFCPGSPFEGWQMKVAGSVGKNDNGILEVYHDEIGKWIRVTSREFRSWGGKRKITESGT